MSVQVITGFDGSCPHHDKGVRRETETRVVFFPSYREQEGIDQESLAVGTGCRFCVRLKNAGSASERMQVVADWETSKHVAVQDIGFVRHENDDADDWRMITGTINGTQVTFDLALQPGVTELGLCPSYNTERLARFVEQAAARGVEVGSVGKSGQGRDIPLLSFPSKNPAARNFLVQARDHAYETAGSYCVEGIVDYLLSSDPVAEFIRTKFNVRILPMTNPDGVYNGMSRLTWERGLNVDQIDWNADAGPEVSALVAHAEAFRAIGFMNIHNYCMKFYDQLMIAEKEMADKVFQHIPADTAHYKRWQLVDNEFRRARGGPTDKEEGCHLGWRLYHARNFDAVSCVYELPWFARTPKDMKRRGTEAFVAMALATVELKGL